MPTVSPTPDEKHALVSWMRWGGPLVLVASLALHVAAYCGCFMYARQIDTMVYRFGGARVLLGLELC